MTKARAAERRTSKERDTTQAFEEAVARVPGGTYRLKLYITGSTPRSVTAIQNIKRICEERLKGRYQLEIVDLYQNPEAAAREHLIVAPTLVKRLPLPLRTFIGDMSQTEKILVGLDLARRIVPRSKKAKEP